ncbi:NADP-dependent oxidoreductase [Microbispora triticiradicis]|uniref:NADP-dependent oxidoreductase n=1 Tax=Microbispora triticiradicis TaxID=2200763 RepID=A0ABX9LPL5_9ACTN|nr:NADP-dependent oxidoreductase [Microbispora triticiradicis]RGA05952.1 NADP-dependent oxidoreductase [Microbispora triticiradicis]GLW22003.1 NADP-dependent oxidoreductase [Microbispora amethystogenes]
MSETPPGTVREIRLTEVPSGLPGPEHLAVVEVPTPVPGAGEVLVRNCCFQVFPALRTLTAGGVPGAPFPPLRPGDTLFGPAVGEVVTAGDGASLRPGDLVSHFQGWREYAVVPDSEPLDGTLPDPAAYLAPGATAYAALTRIAGLRPGETVFVSGGAGGVGSLAGQIARLLGAARVIGSTGSAAKAERMTAELGYDAVVLRGDGPFGVRLAEAAPDGIDVVVDNVGGEQLRAAADAARPGARLVLVGTLATQLSAASTGATAPVELDTFRLILGNITLRGLTGVDAATTAEWRERFGAWLRSGSISFPHTRIPGIDRAPQALRELFDGRHVGTVVVEP